MGFASKLAASVGPYYQPPPPPSRPLAPPVYAPSPDDQQSSAEYGHQSGQYDNQPHYPLSPHGNSQDRPARYDPWAPEEPNPERVQAYKERLLSRIKLSFSESYYPNGDPRVDDLSDKLARYKAVERLSFEWKISEEVAIDMVQLALFDIVIFIDDSGSMTCENRIDDLKTQLKKIAFAAALFDDDGVSVRFMNNDPALGTRVDKLKSDDDIAQLLHNHKWDNNTPLGTKLKEKVIQSQESEVLQKPILVMTITDGEPRGEPRHKLVETIRYAKYAKDEFEKDKFAKGTFFFTFVQVGHDQAAQDFLAELDNDKDVGNLVDCVSYFENEQAEMAKYTPVALTRQLYYLKMMLGAIDHNYDKMDEGVLLVQKEEQTEQPKPKGFKKWKEKLLSPKSQGPSSKSSGEQSRRR